MIERVEVVADRYYDSVRLMQASRMVAALPGVERALVAMATELNRRLATDMGFEPSHLTGAGADDLIVALRTVDEVAMGSAQELLDRTLSDRTAVGDQGRGVPAPRTVEAAGRLVGANLAMISTPGRYAFVEAMAALRAGMHIMVFSNDVPMEQEIRLKREGAARGLAVMGPDCGTAIIGGLGLGFANAVDPGPVGIAGASGTGIQQLCSLLDAAGVGVRHAIGTGSRDLSASVRGTGTLQALTALDRDPDVEVIIVVSKPPAPEVGALIAEAIGSCETPVVPAMLGSPTVTLEGAARGALQALGTPDPEFPAWRPSPGVAARAGWLVGLFSGGTLRDEAALIASALLGEPASHPDVAGHRMIDFGSDEYTRGRPHPMIDPGLRLDALAAAASDPDTAVILLDLVIGHGAHPDPASVFVPGVAAARAAGTAVVVSLCGTRHDPQGRDGQAVALRDAGAEVYLSNAAAARRAAGLVEGDPR